MTATLVLIVGAADTGRAPMAAALLGRLLAREHLEWRVESAGIVGHDGDAAEPEARSAMLTMGFTIDDHVARSLDDALAAEAAVLLAVEAGVARVLRGRYPGARVVTLGELAGRSRDIPDPFRMQLGAWLHYAGEIDTLLRAGLPRLRALVAPGQAEAPPAPAATGPVPTPPEPAFSLDPARAAAVERATRLLTLAADMPGVLDWGVATAQLRADLAALEHPQAPDDLARAYVAVLRARLDDQPPPEARARALAAAVAQLRAPITPADLERLAREL